MDTKLRRDDARRAGDDVLDRVIDEAVESALRAGPVELRAQVLEGLERIDRLEASPTAAEVRPERAWLRPAFLPVAGALLMMAGVGVLWQHASQQLAQTAVHARPGVTYAGRPAAPSVQPVREAVVESPAAGGVAAAATGASPEGDLPVRRRKSPAWLESDSDTKVAGASLEVADVDSDEPTLPGAPVTDLGGPIAPMPRPRPIVIEPLTTPLIAEAPPISSLARPVSTLADEAPRDRQDPGRPGGKRP